MNGKMKCGTSFKKRKQTKQEECLNVDFQLIWNSLNYLFTFFLLCVATCIPLAPEFNFLLVTSGFKTNYTWMTGWHQLISSVGSAKAVPSVAAGIVDVNEKLQEVTGKLRHKQKPPLHMLPLGKTLCLWSPSFLQVYDLVGYLFPVRLQLPYAKTKSSWKKKWLVRGSDVVCFSVNLGLQEDSECRMINNNNN